MAKSTKRFYFLTHPLSRIRFHDRYKTVSVFAKRYPLRAFFGLLLLLFVVIILGSLLTPQKKENQNKAVTKSVQTYAIGKLPQIIVQAKVRKTGIVTIAAQASGVVQNITVTEGDSVAKGQQLITLSSNYQGGNAPAIQTQIAAAQLKNLNDSYPTQLGIIQDQKDIATASAAISQKTRDITGDTISRSQSAYDYNNDLINGLSQTLLTLQSTNTNGLNQTTISQTEQQLSQLQSGQSQLQQAIANAQYQSGSGNPPSTLANAQQDLSLKQLDVQKSSLDLGKSVAQLQENLAAVTEATMYPATPIDGVVQKVSVRIGQLVTPGTPLITVSGSSDDPITAIVSVPQSIAQNIAVNQQSVMTIGNTKVFVTPSFVSTDAIDGNQYSVYFPISEDYADLVTDGQFISVQIPVGQGSVITNTPYVPIDAIYQTQDAAYLYVLKNGKAESKTVTLGQVYGDYVQVLSGLRSGDTVIVTRNVIDGDKVAVQL